MFKFVVIAFLLLQVETSDISDKIIQQVDRYTTILHEYQEVVATIQQLKRSDQMKDRFCELCEKVADYVLDFRRRNADREAMVALLQYICVQLTDYDEESCWGHMHINIDVVLYILDNKKDLSGARVCAIMYQPNNCKDPDMEKWTINLPPRKHVETQMLQKNTTRDAPIKIMHLTDIHYDPLYLPGGNADCYEKELCCQRESTLKVNGSYVPAGHWGDYHTCDVPWHTIQSAFDDIKARNFNSDFVYYTGDIISHRTWTTNRVSNTFDIKTVMNSLQDTFGSTPVYPVLGNHEAHPVNYYSPEYLAQANFSIQWLFDLSYDEWSKWLPADTRDTIQRGGFYTIVIKPGLRLIALNTNVCFVSNMWLLYDDKDPYGQLQWLVDVLLKAEESGEYVHIISHVPNWQPECFVTWSHEYRRIINRFAHIISAQFNGHTHEDQFQLFYNISNPQQVINVAYNGGSITTFIANNPNYRVYDVSPTNYSVIDYDEFTFNLTEANLTPNKPPRWYKLYSFKEAYGLENLSYEQLGDLIKRMTTDASIMQKYFRYYVRESDKLLADGCNSECLADKFCEIISSESSLTLECLERKKLYFQNRPNLVQQI